MATQQVWFKVGEAAQYLRVSRRTIYSLCEQGLLVGHRTSSRGHWRFRKEELDQALRRGTPEADDTEGLVTLTATADPILAEVWDNDRDAAYDRL